MLRILSTDALGDLYLTFNSKKGITVGTLEFENQVTITRSLLEYSQSWNIGALAARGVFTIANFDGTGKALEVTAGTFTASVAEITVAFGNAVVEVPTAAPVAALTSEPVQPVSSPTTTPPVAAPTVSPMSLPVSPPVSPPTTAPPVSAPTPTPPTCLQRFRQCTSNDQCCSGDCRRGFSRFSRSGRCI